MMFDYCFNCEHCDTNRTNDKGEVRCKRFSTFVDIFHNCDCHSSKKMQELAEELRKSGVNYDR
jgi:hypothetical protein